MKPFAALQAVLIPCATLWFFGGNIYLSLFTLASILSQAITGIMNSRKGMLITEAAAFLYFTSFDTFY